MQWAAVASERPHLPILHLLVASSQLLRPTYKHRGHKSSPALNLQRRRSPRQARLPRGHPGSGVSRRSRSTSPPISPRQRLRPVPSCLLHLASCALSLPLLTHYWPASRRSPRLLVLISEHIRRPRCGIETRPESLLPSPGRFIRWELGCSTCKFPKLNLLPLDLLLLIIPSSYGATLMHVTNNIIYIDISFLVFIYIEKRNQTR